MTKDEFSKYLTLANAAQMAIVMDNNAPEAIGAYATYIASIEHTEVSLDLVTGHLEVLFLMIADQNGLSLETVRSVIHNALVEVGLRPA